MGVIIFHSTFTMDAIAAEPYNGYLFCACGQNAYLIDQDGETVHTWRATSSARSCAYLLPDGSAVFPIQTSCPVRGDGAYPHGRLQKISWEGDIVWDAVVCDNTYTPGYDLEPMPNGNFLVAGASNTGGLKIVEVKSVGTDDHEVVWEYYLPDSLGNNGYINSICYNPELNYVGLDINRAKKLVVIDYETKTIVYTYPVTSGSATHAALWVTKYFLGTDIELPDADIDAMRTNNLLVVNNSTQVVEVDPINEKLETTIRYSFSAHEGSAQRLPNGNTLVSAARNTATEITDDGSTVRTIQLPASAARAYMFGPSYPGLMDFTRISTSTPEVSPVRGFTYNQATDLGTVILEKANENPVQIRIYSLSGKIVYSKKAHGKAVAFSTRDFVPGVYYITLHSNAFGTYKSKFVKM